MKNILILLILISSSFGNEALIELYRREIPMTFGLLMDLNAKMFSIKNQYSYLKTELYIGKSGNIQLHLEFERSKLPSSKDKAEQMIEDMSMKIKSQAEILVKDLWKIYPGELPYSAFADGKELVTTVVFLNGKQIGYSEENRFYWRTQPRPQGPVTNKW
jgi:hypothetical protein